MEFLGLNLFNTSTQSTVDSNTATATYLYNRDIVFQWSSDGYDNDLTTSSVTINFGSTVEVNRFAILGHNLKDFTIFYDGTTSNTFSLTTTAATTTSDFSANSDTSNYLRFDTVTLTSITIDMQSTHVADSEKGIGYVFAGELDYELTHLPAASGYKPVFDVKEIKHLIGDGGSRIHTIQEKFNAMIKLTNMTKAVRDSLKSVFDRKDPFNFVPFGTSTGWDEVLRECVWPGKFDLYTFADNSIDAGYKGSIKVEETPF